MQKLLRRLAYLFRRDRLEDELDEELRFHVEMKQQELEAEGLDTEAAARTSRRAVGNVPLTRNKARDVWIWPWLQDAGQDLRYAFRSLRRNPGLAAAAVTSLALGLGVNTAVFAVTYGLLFRPLPYAEPSRLVILSTTLPNGADGGFGLPEVDEWRQRLSTVEGVAAYTVQDLSVRGGSEPHVIRTGLVTESFWEVLGGVAAAVQQPDTAIVSGRAVGQLFGSASDNVVGRTLTFGERAYSVVSVADSDVAFPTDDVHAWIPVRWQSGQGPPPLVRLIARLKPWATINDARNDARRAYVEMRGEGSMPAGQRAPTTVTTLDAAQLGTVRPVLQAMTVGSLLVLLIACANVAILFLGRAAVRRHESAMRLALGASPGRLVRLALAESFIIAVVASAFALAMVMTGLHVVSTTIAGVLPRVTSVVLDGPVLAASLAMTVVAALVCGVLPGLHLSRSRFASAFQGFAPTATATTWRLRAILVIGQIALTMVLLVGAGLLARTVTQLLQQDVGIDPRHALAVKLVLGDTPRLDAQERHHQFVREWLARVEVLPGVERAGIGGTLPPRVAPLRIGVRFMTDDRDEFQMLSLGSVTPGYFRSLGAQFVGGRDFTDRDDEAVILSESAARFYFPDGDPIGRQLSQGLPPIMGMSEPLVIGVVRDVRYAGLDTPPSGAIYAPWHRVPSGVSYGVVRTTGDPLLLASGIREIVRSLDPSLPVPDIRTLEEELATSIADRRLRVIPAFGFAALSIAVAFVGLLATLSRAVVERRRELAIRAALGASPRNVVGMVIRTGVRLTLAGVVVGLAASLAAGRGLGHLLYGVSTHDVATFAAATVLVVAVCLVASYAPARSAANVDPVTVLRAE
jgi:putative ABC transport system permease protein